jgi:hypothetical protein
MTTPLMCDALIDCYVAVFLQNDRWTEGLSNPELAVHREQVISLFHDNPSLSLISLSKWDMVYITEKKGHGPTFVSPSTGFTNECSP